MLKFSLDDLNVEGLQKIASYYGVSTQGDRAQLVERIRQRMSVRTQVVLAEGASTWWKSPAILVAVLAAVIAASAMIATWYNAGTAATNLQRTIAKDLEQKQAEKVAQWQKVMVFSIIRQADLKGVGLEEIRRKYIQEATTVQEVDLKKEDLQPMVLHRILMDLQCSGLIFNLLDGNYVAMRASVPPRTARMHVDELAKDVTVRAIIRRPGQLTKAEIGPIVADELKISNASFELILISLISNREVIVDEEGKLWPATNPPPRKKAP